MSSDSLTQCRLAQVGQVELLALLPDYLGDSRVVDVGGSAEQMMLELVVQAAQEPG